MAYDNSNTQQAKVVQDPEFRAAFEAGMSVGSPQSSGSLSRFVVIPSGAKVHEFNTNAIETIERKLTGKFPSRKTGTITVHDGASFADYFNRFKGDGSLVFADEIAKQFVGILDYHKPGTETAADWLDHRVVFSPIQTDQWKAWHGKNNQQFAQSDFALFIEDNLADVVEPAGMTLLEIAKTLEAKNTVEFSSGVRLNNGQVQLTYTEEIKGTAAQGTIQIPETFTLGLPVYLNGSAYKIVARLRYRIAQGGKLTFWFRMNAVERIVQDAFNDVAKAIQAQTQTLMIRGSIG